jgi:precorrin-6B methylase 2
MPFEQHQEKAYPQEAQSLYQAALKATEKLGGTVITSAPEKLRFEARFPKVILGKTLGERTQLACEVRPGGVVVVDAFPLDALERKLMFGARKGVTATVVAWFTAHLEHHLGSGPS